MKKLFALILSLVMMTVLSVPAFAAQYTEPKTGMGTGDTAAITVQGTYTLGSSTPTYSIDITWTNMVFEYTANATWNPSTLQDEDAGTGGSWSAGAEGGKVTVSNKSNAPVTVTMTFVGTAAAPENQIATSITGKINSGTNVYTETAAAKTGTVVGTLSIEGALKSNTTTTVDIGTLTVTLAA